MARQKSKLCPSCHTLFRGKDTAKTCSARCRKRIERAKKALAHEAHSLAQSAESALKSTSQAIQSFESAAFPQLAPVTAEVPPDFSNDTSPQPSEAGFLETSFAKIETPTAVHPVGHVISPQPSTPVAPATQPVIPQPPAPTFNSSQAPPPSVQPLTAEPLVQSLETKPSFAQAPSLPLAISPPPAPVAPVPELSGATPAFPTPPVDFNSSPGNSGPFNFFSHRPILTGLGFVTLIALISGAFALSGLLGQGKPDTTNLSAQTTDTTALAAKDTKLTLNLDTILAKGKSLTLGQLIADPTSGILQLTGDFTASGNLSASGGTTSLNNAGLTINKTLVCTAAGCLPNANIGTGAAGLTALPAATTLQGNTFNGISQLVQLTAGGLLPVLSGTNLTALNASNISSGTLTDTRLSTNVALLDATGPQTFTGNNKFSGTFLAQNTTNSTTAFQIQNAAGTSNLLIADTTNNRITIAQTTGTYTLDVNGDINSTTGVRVGGALLCSASGCTAGAGSANYIQNSLNLQTANFNIQSVATTSVTGIIRAMAAQSADLLQLKDSSGTNVVTIGPTGNTLIQPSTNSTSAFQVFNKDATSHLIGGDTLNARVAIAKPTPPDYTLDVGGDINSTTGLRVAGNLVCSLTCTPGGGSGNYVQNGIALQTANFAVQSDLNTHIGGLIRGASGQSADLLDLVAGDLGTNVVSFGASGATLFKNSTDSTTAFQLQNLAGNNLLAVDTTTAAPIVSLGVTGSTALASTVNIATTTGNSTQTVNIGATNSANNAVLIQGGTGASAIGLQAGTSGTISVGTTNVNTVTVGSTANTGTLTFGQSSAGETISIGNGNVATGNTNTINIGATATSTGKDVITIGSLIAASTLTLQGGNTSSAVSIQSTTSGTISLGSSGVANTIQIGNTTGAVAQTINIGNNTTASSTSTVVLGSAVGTSATTIQGGTGNSVNLQSQGTIKVGNNAVAQIVTIGNSTGATSVSVNCGLGNCNFGTNVIDHETDLGSTTGASFTLLEAGSSGIAARSTSSTAFVIQKTDGTGTILTADTSGVKITLGSASATPVILVLGNKNTSGDPTCTAGAIYFNSSTGNADTAKPRSCQDVPLGFTTLGLPTGAIIQFGGSTAPAGYLIADGSAVSRTTYAALFSVYSTTYGVGDGSTTFNLPDLRGRVAVGLNTSEVTRTDVNALGNNEGAVIGSRTPYHMSTVVQPTISKPNVTINDPGHVHPNTTPASITGNAGCTVCGAYTPSGTLGDSGSATTGITASLASTPTATGGTVGPQSNVPTDTPAYLTVNYIIKY